MVFANQVCSVVDRLCCIDTGYHFRIRSVSEKSVGVCVYNKSVMVADEECRGCMWVGWASCLCFDLQTTTYRNAAVGTLKPKKH